MAFMFFKKSTKKGQERLFKQNNLPLNFFVDKFSGEAYFYNHLHSFLMPYNIGRHFALGTKKVKDIAYKLPEPNLEDCFKEIQREIISINFFIENNNFQYKDLSDIKKHSIPVNKHKLISSSEIFLRLIETYYTSIFPILYKMEGILDVEENPEGNTAFNSLIMSLTSSIAEKNKKMKSLNGIGDEYEIPEPEEVKNIIEYNESKQPEHLSIIDELNIEQPSNTTK